MFLLLCQFNGIYTYLRRAKSVSYSIHIIAINVMQTKG